jgi:hypothetical protein
MTERLVRAMSLPNHRPEIDCDVPAVLDALARSQGDVGPEAARGLRLSPGAFGSELVHV